MNEVSVTHLLLSANAFLIGVLWVSFRGWMGRVNQKLDKVNDCVTWEELGKELGPLKAGQVNHGERLVALETNCKAEHGK